ncbi:hypothetical protein B296_00006838 [Ensete ventricosum]|uniref:Uncharacterized protein n=1 Tax=Ensete ventricosum TaxID=4639 RepID=A0A426YYG1_ENSVE|nr:hypothetical protein B296_00006838 [Ensete ventricosum]
MAAAPACRQPPCQGAPAPAASVAPVGGTSVGIDPTGTSLLAVGLAKDDSPLRAAALATGLAVGGRPCKGPGHGWPTLQGVWPWLATLVGGLAGYPLFATFATKT